jgi:hypothetical protein
MDLVSGREGKLNEDGLSDLRRKGNMSNGKRKQNREGKE